MKLLEDGYQKAQGELSADKEAPPKITKLEKDFEVRHSSLKAETVLYIL